MTCPVCNVEELDIVLKNDLTHVRMDKYPVSKGHMLIIPNRHFSNYFDATEEERTALWQLVDEAKHLLRQDFSPDGYNMGINVGKAAGQTVAYCHIHLIPRYEKDMKDPEGGVRGVIPGKQKY